MVFGGVIFSAVVLVLLSVNDTARVGAGRVGAKLFCWKSDGRFVDKLASGDLDEVAFKAKSGRGRLC